MKNKIDFLCRLPKVNKLSQQSQNLKNNKERKMSKELESNRQTRLIGKCQGLKQLHQRTPKPIVKKLQIGLPCMRRKFSIIAKKNANLFSSIIIAVTKTWYKRMKGPKPWSENVTKQAKLDKIKCSNSPPSKLNITLHRKRKLLIIAQWKEGLVSLVANDQFEESIILRNQLLKNDY